MLLSHHAIIELLLWLTVGAYAMASVGFIFRISFEKEILSRTAWFLTLFGLTTHLTSVLYRWVLVGHGPYRTIHEILVCDSSFIVAAFVVTCLLQPRAKIFSVIVLPLALITMGFGLMAAQGGTYLSPSLKSPWLAVHVLFAKMTVGCIVVATGLAFGLLLRQWAGKKRLPRFIALLPDNKTISSLCRRLIQIAFIFASLMIIAGAIWANDAWGRYWGWDPIETWSLIAWTLYGLILHIRLSWNISDRLYAGFILAAFVISIVAFFLIPFTYESIHSQYFT